MIRVTFTDDGSTCDLDDDTAVQVWGRLWPLSLRNLRGQDDVTVGGRPVTVESFEEQIARLTAERDAATRHLAAAVEQAIALRDIEYRRAEAEKARADAATAWGSREAEALRLTTRALSLACSPIEDDVAREVLIRAICAAKEALVKAQPGMALNVGDVCSRLARTDAAEKRLADLRAWADDIVKRSREEAPKHPGKANTTWTILSVLEWVVARIDGKDGESK